ncbi:beta-mannosidase [Melioribacter sp. OK-6-Me]|uniref:beta-mannosidase n=1 Tax=unclassified Melioribacter TaxID=2627329 RepID=UPI003ED96D5F
MKIIVLDKWYLKLGKQYSPSVPETIKKRVNIEAEVPGTVHTDLLKNQLIEDPFYADNEKNLSWISESDWIYETTFDNKIEGPVKLVFEGIDTISEIFLNSKLLGKTENMFIKYEFDVTEILKERNNILKVKLYSPVKYSYDEEKKYGVLQVALNSSRVYIRKAQYSFGWDWGPSFPTLGMWKKVYLKALDYQIIDEFYFQTLNLTKKKAVVEIKFRSSYNLPDSILRLSIEDNVIEKNINIKKGINKLIMEVINPKLWMPNGYGKPNLYQLEILLQSKENNINDLFVRKVGIRKIEVRLKEKGENSFKFIINGKEIFAKGVNWIPCDAFLPRVTESRYRKMLKMAVDANMNIIRVWGGGVYENDIFYEICDELGLLIWQDFMFACGAYPEHKEFIDNVKKEIIYNVKRLQYHPSLAIWCGNNENEWIWYQTNKTHYKNMPGYKIYNKIIPDLLKKIDPDRFYWESSPFGYEDDPNSEISGNRHQWEIWSSWKDYEEVVHDKSLFVTEFGFQSAANKFTIEKYIPKHERKINSETFEFHNKQIEGPERIIRFLSAHLPLSTKWEDYFYLTQLNQAIALKTCIQHWRFNKITKGAIIWQLNDTWPVTSWSLIDSMSMPKISYYFVKKIFEPITFRIIQEEDDIKIYGLNETENELKVLLKIKIIDSKNGILNYLSTSVSLGRNRYEKIKEVKSKYGKEAIYVISIFKDDSLIFRDAVPMKKWKYLHLSKPNIKFSFKKIDNENILELNTDKPAFFVDVEYDDVMFSNRGFILLPDEKILLRMDGFKGKFNKNKLKIYSLNDYL